MMKLNTAAAYCEMKPADFVREMASGRFPVPVVLEGGERWDREELDKVLTGLSAYEDDWRKGCPGICD